MAAETNGVLRKTVQTWYGLPVDIAVSRSNWHRVMLPGIALPHLGLVNLLTRRSLPLDKRLALIWRHEFGHLQTLPLPVVHLLLVLWPRRVRRKGSRWQRVLVGLVAHHAVWEIAAEGYVAFHSWREQNHPYSMAGRDVYAGWWCVIGLLATAGTAFLIGREGSCDDA